MGWRGWAMTGRLEPGAGQEILARGPLALLLQDAPIQQEGELVGPGGWSHERSHGMELCTGM
jgi:hypothetical protein